MAQEKEKLTYEQLEAYANQTVAQARKIYQENETLVEEIKRLRDQRNFTEITLAFKVLEHKEMFSPEFVQEITLRLEEVLTPVEKEEQTKEEVKE
jgi:cell division protein FtsB